MAKLTKNEIDKFKQLSLNDVDEIDDSQWIKSAFYLTNINFKKIRNLQKTFHNFIVHLLDSVDIFKFINEIRENIESDKNKINVIIDSMLDNEKFITRANINVNKDYVVERVNDTHLKIYSSEDWSWNPSNIIVQVKNNEGVVLYPIIKTTESMLEIQFSTKPDYEVTIHWI